MNAKQTRVLDGHLEMDYSRNRVVFHPNQLGETVFQLPLQPLDVDIVQSLARIAEKLTNGSARCTT
jgi:hypothetical protein